MTCLIALSLNPLLAQNWQTEQLSQIPEAVANNAVAGAMVEGSYKVYSFAGIDTSKNYAGIHLNTWKYEADTDMWTALDPLPDDPGVIAAGASTVKGLVYIIGGYHVAANGSETSSARVNILDPATDSYLSPGMDIPVPIDDQVQAVYRDSLIYIVTGWSNSGNVRDVQIYDPSADNWLEGTPVPNESAYKVFGASGDILGDTLYYAGGARYGVNFPLTGTLKKGYINPENPTQIDWQIVVAPEALGYRMASFVHDGKIYWLGGSQVSYNYDGIAYNGSGPVSSSDRILEYDPETGQFSEFEAAIPPTMDLRGIAKVGENKYIVAGGMEEGQLVTGQTFLLRDLDIVPADNGSIRETHLSIYPNPALDQFWIQLKTPGNLEIRDVQGKLLLSKAMTKHEAVDISALPKGLLICTIDGIQSTKVVKR